MAEDKIKIVKLPLVDVDSLDTAFVPITTLQDGIRKTKRLTIRKATNDEYGLVKVKDTLIFGDPNPVTPNAIVAGMGQGFTYNAIDGCLYFDTDKAFNAVPLTEADIPISPYSGLIDEETGGSLLDELSPNEQLIDEGL